MAQPSTDYPTDGSYNGRTQCQHARFQVSSDGPSSPVLCGTNSGEHMYVEASSDCNEVSSTELDQEDGEQMYYLPSGILFQFSIRNPIIGKLSTD